MRASPPRGALTALTSLHLHAEGVLLDEEVVSSVSRKGKLARSANQLMTSG